MEPSKLNELPFWFQVVTGAGLFFGAMSVAALGWIKPKLTHLLKQDAPPEKAVVLSAQFTDKQAMTDLTEAIYSLCRQIQRNDADDRDDIDRLRRDQRDMIDEMARLTKALRDRVIV